MLVVKIEVWPGGREREAVEIGRAAIVNVNGLADLSDYIVIARDDRGDGPQRIVRRHRRSDGFWPLLARGFAPGSPGHLPGRWRDAGPLITARAGLDQC